ncbi:hypothetical protein RI129_000048 [Pyrocoelia pectoralis]|uniref:Retrotransposon gag domain-containing protein n=1 Tax=Pyrocoelia pectoralis TaxID=417401 RepID=A0AAN7US03_9COLE
MTSPNYPNSQNNNENTPLNVSSSSQNSNNNCKFSIDFLSKISGRAKEQLPCRTFSDWDSLKAKLKDLYQDKKHYSQVMEELNNCKQHFNESVHDFFQRLEILNSRALASVKLQNQDISLLQGKIQAIEEITLSRFVFHSIPAISQMLRWKDFDSLNAAFTAAISEERAINLNKFNKPKFCKFVNGIIIMLQNVGLNNRIKIHIKQFIWYKTKIQSVIIHSLNPVIIVKNQVT